LNKEKRLAVLIDADNAQAKIVKELLVEVSKYGTAHIKRIYGDWTDTKLRSWKNSLNEYAIQPIQQFSYTNGKNSTDASLIIDAMDILHTNSLDGFCIVSSDSDFTRLATRIRESGLTVYGFGEGKTPKPFISACDEFVYTENLVKSDTDPFTLSEENRDELRSILLRAIDATSDDDGWSLITKVNLHIKKSNPAFDHRTYGFDKLSQLIKSLDYLETKAEAFNDGSTNKHIFVKVVS